jgi:hypothetical protein
MFLHYFCSFGQETAARHIPGLYCARYQATSVCCSEAPHCENLKASGATVGRKDAAAAMRDDGLGAACSHRVAARRRAPQERPLLGMHFPSSSWS